MTPGWIPLLVLVVGAGGALGGLDLEPITVTAPSPPSLTEVPGTPQILDRQDIEASGAQNLQDLLKAYGLVQDQETSHGDQAGIQGLGGKRILFLVDGRRIPGRTAQNLEGGSLGLGSVERIEILTGPQSALYGSEALGGVINIITRPATPKLTGEVQVTNLAVPQADSWTARTGGLVLLRGPLGPSRGRWSLEGERRSFVLEKTREVSVLPQGTSVSTDGVWEVSTPQFSLEAGGTYTLLREEDQVDFTGSLERKDLSRLQGYLKGSILGERTWEFQGYTHHYGRERASYQGGLDLWTKEPPTTETILGFLGTYHQDLGPQGLLTAGTEVLWTFLEDADLSAEASQGLDRQALFLRLDYFEDQAWALQGALRVERIGRFGGFAAPQATLVLHGGPQVRVVASTGLGYRAPEAQDLYNNIDWSWHPRVLGNPDLDSEFSWGANFRGEWSWAPRSSLHLEVHHQELFDEMTYVEVGTLPDGRVVYQNQNQARTFRTGGEVRLAWALLDPLVFEGTAQVLRAWDRIANAPLAGVVEQSLRGTLTYTPWEDTLTLTATGRWDSQKNLTLWDAGIRWYLTPQWNLSLRGENLTGVLNPRYGPFTPQSLRLSTAFHF